MNNETYFADFSVKQLEARFDELIEYYERVNTSDLAGVLHPSWAGYVNRVFESGDPEDPWNNVGDVEDELYRRGA